MDALFLTEDPFVLDSSADELLDNRGSAAPEADRNDHTSDPSSSSAVPSRSASANTNTNINATASASASASANALPPRLSPQQQPQQQPQAPIPLHVDVVDSATVVSCSSNGTVSPDCYLCESHQQQQQQQQQQGTYPYASKSSDSGLEHCLPPPASAYDGMSDSEMAALLEPSDLFQVPSSSKANANAASYYPLLNARRVSMYGQLQSPTLGAIATPYMPYGFDAAPELAPGGNPQQPVVVGTAAVNHTYVPPLEFDLADHQEAVACNFFLDAGAGLGVQASSSGTNQGASNTPAPSKAADADAHADGGAHHPGPHPDERSPKRPRSASLPGRIGGQGEITPESKSVAESLMRFSRNGPNGGGVQHQHQPMPPMPPMPSRRAAQPGSGGRVGPGIPVGNALAPRPKLPLEGAAHARAQQQQQQQQQQQDLQAQQQQLLQNQQFQLFLLHQGQSNAAAAAAAAASLAPLAPTPATPSSSAMAAAAAGTGGIDPVATAAALAAHPCSARGDQPRSLLLGSPSASPPALKLPTHSRAAAPAKAGGNPRRAGSGVPHYTLRTVHNLSGTDDASWLSQYLSYVRNKCAEVYVATPADVKSRNNSKKIVPGQVGIRCRYCAHLHHRDRAGRSSSFPSSKSRIYQSITMMLRDHFPRCSEMPEDVRSRFFALKNLTSQGATDSKRYWVDSAGELGMIDTDEGIKMSDESGHGLVAAAAASASDAAKPNSTLSCVETA